MGAGIGSLASLKSLPPQLLLALLLGALTGCSGDAPRQLGAPGKAQVAKPQGHCAQSQWQAQTAPVINKREGNEALEKYDAEGQEQEAGCH